jgi:hypothetical protein
MKARDFREFLIAAQEFRADDTGRRLGQLAQVFEVLPDKTVADVVKRLDEVRPSPASFSTVRLGSLREPLLLLHRLVASRAKEGLVKDVLLLKDLVERNSSIALDAFVSAAVETLRSPAARGKGGTKPVRSDLVETYDRRLEEALGNDTRFQSVFGELVRDSEIGSAEATALARRFAKAATRSKDVAFKKIYARHQALMTSRAKSLATAGRVAG